MTDEMNQADVEDAHILTPAKLDGLYPQFLADFPPEAVEHTKASVTRKGYDTTGYQYQFEVNRLNEVLGISHWRTVDETTIIGTSTTDSGRERYEYICKLTLQIGNAVEGQWHILAERTCYGGHISNTHGDGAKGAFTNALKKTLGLFGVGHRAYEGTLDEDYRPIPADAASNHEADNGGRHSADSHGDKPLCPVHQEPMRFFPEKGRWPATWKCSVKTDDGYCSERISPEAWEAETKRLATPPADPPPEPTPAQEETPAPTSAPERRKLQCPTSSTVEDFANTSRDRYADIGSKDTNQLVSGILNGEKTLLNHPSYGFDDVLCTDCREAFGLSEPPTYKDNAAALRGYYAWLRHIAQGGDA